MYKIREMGIMLDISKNYRTGNRNTIEVGILYSAMKLEHKEPGKAT